MHIYGSYFEHSVNHIDYLYLDIVLGHRFSPSPNYFGRVLLKNIKGKFLLSYNDCPEIRELYEGFSIFDFSRTHSMAQRYEAGKKFGELLIGNYDLYERERSKPQQLTLFNVYGFEEDYDYEKVLKECIISCKIRN